MEQSVTVRLPIEAIRIALKQGRETDPPLSEEALAALGLAWIEYTGRPFDPESD